MLIFEHFQRNQKTRLKQPLKNFELAFMPLKKNTLGSRRAVSGGDSAFELPCVDCVSVGLHGVHVFYNLSSLLLQ